MAALDRRNPNLDDFVGLNWSCWVDRANILPSDAGLNVEDGSKDGRKCSETMTLRKEDMHIYGQCPAHDDFFLVMCSHCGQVVKPQAFEKHCERRHSPFTKMCSQPSSLAPQQRPRPARPVNLPPPRERQKDVGRCQEPPLPAALPLHQHKPSKAQKEAVRLTSVEKIPQANPALPHHSASTPRPRAPQLHSGPLPSGLSSSASLSERPPMQKPSARRSTESPSPLRGTRTYSRVYKNIDKKECDLNKHCSVVDQEKKKLCSRELICNADAIQQQPRALGRTKSFDQLAAEQKTASAGRDMEQLPVKSKEKDQNFEALEEKITQSRKFNVNSSCHILSRPKDPSESFPEEEGNSTVKVEVQPPYPFNQNLLSSEESEDGNEEEEATDLPATPWHPKPLGLCTFGCRSLGCSIFTFDRRLHHLRFALSAMLEHHVSSHLWKKMPQVSQGLRSHPTAGSAVRTGTKCPLPTVSLSQESTSLGHLETKTSQHNPHSKRTSPTEPSVSLGSSRRRNPIGRNSKAQLREVDIMQDASVAQKTAKISHGSEDKSFRYIREAPLHEKGQPQALFFRGPVNGTFTQGKNPLPLLPSERHLSGLKKASSPRCKAKPPVIQQKVADYDHRTLGQKRKGSSESQRRASSLSRTSKCQRLSSPPQSSLITWKGESINDVLSWGLEKRADS